MCNNSNTQYAGKRIKKLQLNVCQQIKCMLKNIYVCLKHVPKGPSHPHRYKIETKIGKTHKQPGRHS